MTTKAGKYIFSALILVCIGFVANAQRMRVIVRQQPGYYAPVQQRGGNNLMHVRKLKEEFISKQLLLSPEQTNRFIGVYRQYEQEVGAVRVLKRINNSAASVNGADQVNKELDFERQLYEIKSRYTQEFLKIMPYEKVSLIFKSETIFNDEVIRNLRERNGGAMPPPGN